MSILSSLFNNDKVKELAFGQLRKLMMDNGYAVIILRNNPSNEGGPLPGFDIDFSKTPVIVFPDDNDTVGVSKAQFEKLNKLGELEDAMRASMIAASEEKEYFENVSSEMLIALHDPEVIDYITRYLKAKKLHDNGEYPTENTDNKFYGIDQWGEPIRPVANANGDE